MKLGIFGGTFNPIHYGHLRSAQEVSECLGLERIIFIPSFIPPHKELAHGVPGEQRLETVRLAIQDNQLFELSAFEVEAGVTSYSIKTIEHVRERYQTTPYFILGQDAFNEITSWYEAPRLFSLTHFVVMTRPGVTRQPLAAILGDLSSPFAPTDTGYRNTGGYEIIFVEVTPLDISSSLIRSLCRAGRSIRYLVPPVVENYIVQERIYQ